MKKFFALLGLLIALSIPARAGGSCGPDSSSLADNINGLVGAAAVQDGDLNPPHGLVDEALVPGVIKKLSEGPWFLPNQETWKQDMLKRGVKIFWFERSSQSMLIWGVFDDKDCLVVYGKMGISTWKKILGESA